MSSSLAEAFFACAINSSYETPSNNPNVDLDGSNTAYVIFMIIGIIGYFTIPTVAGWIIQAGGMGSYNRSINNTAMTGGSWAGSIAGGVAGNVAGRAGKLLK